METILLGNYSFKGNKKLCMRGLVGTRFFPPYFSFVTAGE